MQFKGTVIITDPCYLIKNDNPSDWENSEAGISLYVLGFNNYISAPTRQGDWSCEVITYNPSETEAEKESQVFGMFGADSGMVGVFLLEEILKYNPNFEIRSRHMAVFEDFNGSIDFEVTEEGELFIFGGSETLCFYTVSIFGDLMSELKKSLKENKCL
jgi:hypothetical protein